MLDLDAVFERRPDVRFRVVGDEAVVVRQDAAEVIALNDVGARVLELIDAEKTVGGIIEILAGEYDVSSETLRDDVTAFVASIRDAGIVRERYRGPGS